jgi:hypothetical protein
MGTATVLTEVGNFPVPIHIISNLRLHYDAILLYQEYIQPPPIAGQLSLPRLRAADF